MRIYFKKFILLLLPVIALFAGSGNVAAQDTAVSQTEVQIVTDEPEAVLMILEKRASGQEITSGDWDKLFATEGYRRLKKRETVVRRPFEDADFKNFVLSDRLLAERPQLAKTLDEWKKIKVESAARLALAYLPKGTRLRARIYPSIKPKDNSFVFEVAENPAIFLYLDPKISKESFENTLAHELHHIGYGAGCPAQHSAAITSLPQNTQKVYKWLGAFGEGFAMLAAAGGTEIHPQITATLSERERWDSDLKNYNRDLKSIEQFFRGLQSGVLSAEKENEIAGDFYGEQGPWYTVGWQMAVVIEKTYGRRRLIEAMCDRSRLLPLYNAAVGKYNRRYRTQLDQWSKELIDNIHSKP